MATVIITGSNSGFGLQGALAFARNGDTIYACMRNINNATELLDIAAQENLDIRATSLDITLSSTFSGLVNQAVDQTGSIDVLVNNAGILRSGACEDLTEQAIREVMETNFLGHMLLTRAVLPQMRSQSKGKIIMTSSLSGIAGLAGDVFYTASKFALEGATEALRHEVDRWGVHVHLIQAAQYATRIFDPSIAGDTVLPEGYPADSPYKDLIETRLHDVAEGMPQALDPAIVGKLMVEIAASDGSQLRWQADDLSKMVVETMWGQSDTERDEFLRGASGIDWWSEGKSNNK